jgi:hypothetical protein
MMIGERFKIIAMGGTRLKAPTGVAAQNFDSR